MDASVESAAPTTTEESESLEEALGGKCKCVSSIFVKYLALISLGDELAKSTEDYTNGTSLSNGASLSHTANGAGASTFVFGSNAAVSVC